MADTFQLELATPERLFADEQVSEAELPGKDGYMGVLPGHAPLLSALGAGVLTYNGPTGRHVLAIDGGFVEIFENHVRVLADHAELAQDVRVDQARRQLQDAEQALKNAHDAAESDAALRSMRQAQARLDAADRVGGGTGTAG